MGLLGDPLAIHPTQASLEISIQLYLNWWFQYIDIPHHHAGKCAVLSFPQTRSNSTETLQTPLPILVKSHKDLIATTQSFTTVENIKLKPMSSGCWTQSSQMPIQSRCQLNKCSSRPRILLFKPFNGLNKPCGVGRRAVWWQCDWKKIMWESTSGRWLSQWALATS